MAMELSNPGILANSLVEINGLESRQKPLTDDLSGDVQDIEDVDVNGLKGWCLGFDIESEKFIVKAFDGNTFAIASQCLTEWTPLSAEAGGFDLVDMMDYEQFHAGLLHCLTTKGYCVVQTFDREDVRQQIAKDVASLRQGYKRLPIEQAEIVMGSDNRTKALDLDPEELQKESAHELEAMDNKLGDFMMSYVAPVSDYLGLPAWGRSSAILRMPMSANEKVSLEPKPMTDTSDVADFLTWLRRRHLCVIHCVEVESGNLLLHPQAENVDLGAAVIPLAENRIIVFRNDCLSYSYQPLGASLALQSWLLGEPRRFDVRSIRRPPRLDLANLHVMSCMERFPIGCYGADMCWSMFLVGTDALTPWPQARWETEPYYCSDVGQAIATGKSYTVHGSFATQEHLLGFNNEMFGISDYETSMMSCQQRWVLETGYECLHKTGYTLQTLNNEHIIYTLGDSSETWLAIMIDKIAFDRGGAKYCVEADDCSFTCARLSYTFGLRGPVLHCDTACSASMIGLNAACKMMRGGTNNDSAYGDKALCMGILAMQTVFGWVGECAMTMLSPRGRCFTFDKGADGFIRGEGCSGVCINRYNGFADDALEERGRLAVVYGTAANEDGKSASLTAPSGPSQSECIRISLREAQIDPAEVSIGELHGTGTALGDPIEVGANKTVFSKCKRDDNPHRLVSAKAHLGHTEANAGTCGFVKVVLMLIHSCSTPNPHLNALNGHLDTAGYPIFFGNEQLDFGRDGNFGGISSFGFGGANTRGDLWAKQMRGARKHGAKALLDIDQARQWIKTVQHGSELPAQVEPHLHCPW